MEIKTKFKPGDMVWMMSDNRAVPLHVITVAFTAYETKDGIATEIRYAVTTQDLTIHEDCLFASKAELLSSL